MTNDTESKPSEADSSNSKESNGRKSLQMRFHLMAGVVGLAGYILVASLANVSVAWATPWYYLLGWPLFCLGTAWLTQQCPERSWRWPLSMMLGQVFASILYGNTLFPVAMIFVTVLSIPQFVIASYLSRQENSSTKDV
ncbi:hypothetical protein GCM10011403_05040 [Pseudohongiella nitratireducens]|uniref:Uncharacterized protein n=1 Tax=Pseudohongiella nitratireducens TaxID=1768907 RepID=A0A917LR90_9GAMM|nr:hypothetical protein [Pseudohongiella nitratireducens]MDF1622169.1 hypothetical protein [Pseudohongiella nitratireducens]GGG50891.1 hypothetical protein GCM10011403_05040 [Pseudohongiella nitratireducens]